MPPGTGGFFFTITTYPNSGAGSPAVGDQIYIRFFNNNNLQNADFYGDASMYEVENLLGATYDISGMTDLPLPIQLSSFEATAGDGRVNLLWRTASELNNLGFEIYRSLNTSGPYSIIDSYISNEGLVGAGNSNQEKVYEFLDINVSNGNSYYYKIGDVDYTGLRTLHGPILVKPIAQLSEPPAVSDIPDNYKLYTNYPNPFNPETSIRVDIPTSRESSQYAEITVHNNVGSLVKRLFSGTLSAGTHHFKWDGKNQSGNAMATGIYFVSFHTKLFKATKKMVLIR